MRKNLFTAAISGRYGKSALFAIALSTSYVAAAETPDYDANTLTGGWGGLRAEQSGRGWDWDIGMRVDQMSVVKGGLKRGGRPASHIDLKLKADLEKIFDWSGTTAFFNLIDDRGGKTNADYVGSLLGTSNIEVPVNTNRFLHAWVQKEWAEGQWSLLTGIYPIDSEFMVLDSAGVFLQPSYGPTADLSLSQGPSIFNNAAFGLRGKWSSADRSLYVQAAVLDGMPGDPNHAVGTRVKFGAGDGIMTIMEIGHRPIAEVVSFDISAGQERSEAETQAPEAEPGYAKYAFGLWSYSAKADDLVDVDTRDDPIKRRSVGWYALAEKTLMTATPLGDISVFGRYSQNDGNTIPIERSVIMGINLKGPFKGREHDVAGLGYSNGIMSEKYLTVLRNDSITPSRVEQALELTYRFQVDNWLAVQPVLQLIRHPGAEQSVPTTTVIGLRLDLAL